jgi:CMP-N-acetylneuraminate monooxygenase
MVTQYIKTTRPRYYMPYAGMFTERAPRDAYILEHNAKNSASMFSELARTAGAALVRPAHEHQLHFADGDLTLEPVDVGHLVPEEPLVYLEALAREYPYDANASSTTSRAPVIAVIVSCISSPPMTPSNPHALPGDPVRLQAERA